MIPNGESAEESIMGLVIPRRCVVCGESISPYAMWSKWFECSACWQAATALFVIVLCCDKCYPSREHIFGMASHRSG